MNAAAAALLLLAAAARADDSAPPAEAPASPPPVLARWRVRPYVGLSTVRLGGLDEFPMTYLRHQEPQWQQGPFAATVTKRERRLIDFALVQGLEGSVQLDPIISVAARVGRLVAQEGRVRTTAEGPTTVLTDEWFLSADLLTIGGGALFHLPLRPRTRLNVTLFLGGGLASVRLDHRFRRIDAGASFPVLLEGGTIGRGTTFIPEFAFELEHDVSESVTAGVAATVRFGGVQSFDSRYYTSVNRLNGVPEAAAGEPIRDREGSLLSADYSGIMLSVSIAARL